MIKRMLTITCFSFHIITAFAQVVPQEELKQLRTKCEEISKRCVPKQGILKEEVEKIFGQGEHYYDINEMDIKRNPENGLSAEQQELLRKRDERVADSFYYSVCDNAPILIVRYIKGKVDEATYYPVGGKTFPSDIVEARKELEQMQTLEKEYLQKTKGKLR